MDDSRMIAQIILKAPKEYQVPINVIQTNLKTHSKKTLSEVKSSLRHYWKTNFKGKKNMVNNSKMIPATRLYLYKPTFSFIKKFTFLRKVILITFNNRNIVKNIVIIPCLAFLLIMGSFKPAGLALYKVDRVVIDAGHGGKDPGTHGLISQEKIVFKG